VRCCALLCDGVCWYAGDTAGDLTIKTRNLVEVQLVMDNPDNGDKIKYSYIKGRLAEDSYDITERRRSRKQ
jgi:hypothetical protein